MYGSKVLSPSVILAAILNNQLQVKSGSICNSSIESMLSTSVILAAILNYQLQVKSGSICNSSFESMNLENVIIAVEIESRTFNHVQIIAGQLSLTFFKF